MAHRATAEVAGTTLGLGNHPVVVGAQQATGPLAQTLAMADSSGTGPVHTRFQLAEGPGRSACLVVSGLALARTLAVGTALTAAHWSATPRCH